MKKLNRTVLVVVADTHSGSSTGLLPKGNWTGLDGQTVQRSTGQRVLGQQWDECWERVAQLRKGARLVVVSSATSGTTDLLVKLGALAAKEVFVIWTALRAPSVFVTQTATKVFSDLDQCLEFFEKKGFIEK